MRYLLRSPRSAWITLGAIAASLALTACEYEAYIPSHIASAHNAPVLDEAEARATHPQFAPLPVAPLSEAEHAAVTSEVAADFSPGHTAALPLAADKANPFPAPKAHQVAPRASNATPDAGAPCNNSKQCSVACQIAYITDTKGTCYPSTEVPKCVLVLVDKEPSYMCPE